MLPGRMAAVRILAIADLHYRLEHYDWLVQAAADVDVVALAGDLADVASPVPIDVQAVVLEKYLRQLVRAGRGARRLRQPRPGRARRARRAGRRLAASATRRGGVVHRRRQRRRRRHPVHRLPVVGRAGRPGGGAATSLLRRPWTARSVGSGSTTRRRPAPCCARTGGASSPTTTWPAWIAEHQPDDRAVRAHPPGALGRRRVLARAARPHLRCSTPAARSGRCRRTSRSTPTRGRPSGSASSTRRRSSSAEPVSAPGCPRGRAPSRDAPGRRCGAPGCRGSGPPSRGGPRCPPSCSLTSTRYCVSPSSRDAVVRSTASAAPGFSTRKRSGSSTTRTRTSPSARRVAVAGRSSTTDISPNTAPGVSMRAIGTPSRSTVTDPVISTSIRPGRSALLDQHLPRPGRRHRQVGAELEQVGHDPIVLGAAAAPGRGRRVGPPTDPSTAG